MLFALSSLSRSSGSGLSWCLRERTSLLGTFADAGVLNYLEGFGWFSESCLGSWACSKAF